MAPHGTLMTVRFQLSAHKWDGESWYNVCVCTYNHAHLVQWCGGHSGCGFSMLHFRILDLVLEQSHKWKQQATAKPKQIPQGTSTQIQRAFNWWGQNDPMWKASWDGFFTDEVCLIHFCHHYLSAFLVALMSSVQVSVCMWCTMFSANPNTNPLKAILN